MYVVGTCQNNEWSFLNGAECQKYLSRILPIASILRWLQNLHSPPDLLCGFKLISSKFKTNCLLDISTPVFQKPLRLKIFESKFMILCPLFYLTRQIKKKINKKERKQPFLSQHCRSLKQKMRCCLWQFCLPQALCTHSSVLSVLSPK